MIARSLSACAILMAAAAAPPPPPTTPCKLGGVQGKQFGQLLSGTMNSIGPSMEICSNKYLHSDNETMVDVALESCIFTAVRSPVMVVHAFANALGDGIQCAAGSDKSFDGCRRAMNDTYYLMYSPLVNPSTMKRMHSKWQSCSDKDWKKKISRRIFQDFKRAFHEIKSEVGEVSPDGQSFRFVTKGDNPLTKKALLDGQKLLQVLSFVGHILESLTSAMGLDVKDGPCKKEMTDFGQILSDIPQLGKKLQDQCDPSSNQKFIDAQKDASRKKYLSYMKKYQPDKYHSIMTQLTKLAKWKAQTQQTKQKRLFDANAGLSFKNTAMASTAGMLLGATAFISVAAFLAVKFRSCRARQMPYVGIEDPELSEDVEVAAE